MDVRELRLGDDLGGDRLRLLGDCLGVVDLNEHCTRGDVLAAHDRDLSDTPVDPRGDVDRVALTSPCTSSGTGRTRYQIDRLAMTGMTTPTMIAGTRVDL